MVVLAEDDNGNDIVMIDPAGVYLEEAVDQADFRILGQLRMQKFGFDLVQNGDGDGKNHLIYRRREVKIPLGQDSGILTLATKALTLEPDEREPGKSCGQNAEGTQRGWGSLSASHEVFSRPE